ncbi:MAG: HAD family hydrolase [Methanotrichaceae archaeon]|nr:HAD family hydrolase [Methanotrichaceae archaeon]
MRPRLAVVMDVAGTMLQMYRVAKDIPRCRILHDVITTELVMEKEGRALVIPQFNPQEVFDAPPGMPLSEFFRGREEALRISCSSTPVDEEEACAILLRSLVPMSEIQETLGAVASRCPDFYYATGMIVDAQDSIMSYSISTGGRPFAALEGTLKELLAIGAEIYVASGDSPRTVSGLARCPGISMDRIHPISTPLRKAEIVSSLKESYDLVVMVGDGLNDIYALEAADIGILTIQQDTRPCSDLIDAADRVIRDIGELPAILRDRLSDM